MRLHFTMLAAMLIASIGSGCASRTTLTVYCHEGDLVRSDVGQDGSSHGDLTTWWADVHEVLPESRDPEDSAVVGIASGFNIVTGPVAQMDGRPGHEYRISNFHLVWFDSNDEVIWSGLHDYGHEEGTLINTAERPIIGGSGRFLGHDGVSVVTPLGDDWFKVDLHLEN